MIQKPNAAKAVLVAAALLGTIVLGSWSMTLAGQADWGAPRVRVDNEGGRWIIRGARQTIEFDPSDLRLIVRAGSVVWRFLPSFAGDLTAKSGGAMLPLRLADSSAKRVGPYQTGFLKGIKITLTDFRVPVTAPLASPAAAPKSSRKDAGTAAAGSPPPDAPLDLAIQIFLGLEGRDEDLSVRVIASDGAARAREILFPASLDPASFDGTVVPFMQGMLLPKEWPRKVSLYDEISYGRGLYMPWWGHQQRDAAVLVLLETPADAGIRFIHPAGGPTRADVRWLHSLGRWSYPRSVRYAFLERGNYVALAKRYRRYALETGNFVSLKEKIARNPLVGNLLGSPVVHTSILYHIQPDSSYYKKDDPKANHQLVTFDERAADLRRLAARGVRRAYVHLDGWGFRGYDNLHPDILPPSPEAGGWEGMRRFADACAGLGFVFAVHDQYRDYYEDAPSYDPRHTVLNEDGTRPEHAVWFGGKQSILCTSLAPGYVRRNFRGLLAHGVKVRGAYLDVFSVVPGDECYSPEHPVTRAESLRFRGECLDFVRSFGGVVSSEEAADWAIPHLDLVHHAPHALDPNPGQGPAAGIPIPLYSLVYHDALFVPWSLGKGAWGIPETDLGFLYGLSNAGLPYLSIEPADEELEKVRTMCALHERVGLLELVNHEFLDDGGMSVRVTASDRISSPGAPATESGGPWSAFRKQRFTYADGTRVTVDFAAGSYSISPPLK
ncbi:MAG: DUF5696 domain-containing protein [Candidatus Aminicenantales bacterium]